MLTGAELVLIAMVVAITIGLIVLAVRGRQQPVAEATRTITVPTAAHPWLVDVIADLASLPKHTVEWLSHDVLVVTWTRRSGWAIVVAIVLFPLGLVALLTITSAHGTFAVVEEGPSGRIALGGQFSKAAIDVVNRHLSDVHPAGPAADQLRWL